MQVLNSKKLGETKNCNLPGVHVDLPVLSPKDIDDLQNLCCKYKMDYVAASFVQHADDVRFIRKVLDDAGGQDVQIISKIENEAGLLNFEEILQASHWSPLVVAFILPNKCVSCAAMGVQCPSTYQIPALPSDSP